MELSIRNINDLENEIMRLDGLKISQEQALAGRFSGPSAIFATVLSLFPKSPVVEGAKNSGLFSQDFLGLLSRFLLPLALNKTLFRHSNFLVKTAVSLLSQKASHYINEENVMGIWEKLTSLFGKKKEKQA